MAAPKPQSLISRLYVNLFNKSRAFPFLDPKSCLTGLFPQALNTNGQTTIQTLFPLLLLLLLAIGYAYVMPDLSTTLAITLGGGIIFLIICLASTGAALYVLVFAMLLSPEFVAGTTEGASLGRGVTLRVDDFLLLLLGVTWLAKMAVNKELGLFLRTPLNKPIAYYLLACLTSTLLGSLFLKVDLMTGFFFVLKYFEYVFVYFVVVNHLKYRRQAVSYLWALLIVCMIVSILAIDQIPGRVSAPFEGETGEPNTFGGYLLFMICITIGLLLTTESFRSQLIYGAISLFFIIPFFYTQSRSSYLGMIVGTLVFVWLSNKRRWILTGLVLGIILLPFVTPKEVTQRVGFTFTQRLHEGRQVTIGGARLDTSTSARLMDWVHVFRDFPTHPFFGYGVTGYKFLDAQYFKVLIETGIIGMGFFIILMSRIFKLARHNYKTTADPFEKGLCMGFLAGFVGLLAHATGSNTFIIVRIMEPFWFVLAMIVVLPDLESEPTDQETDAKTVKPLPRGL